VKEEYGLELGMTSRDISGLIRISLCQTARSLRNLCGKDYANKGTRLFVHKTVYNTKVTLAEDGIEGVIGFWHLLLFCFILSIPSGGHVVTQQ